MRKIKFLSMFMVLAVLLGLGMGVLPSGKAWASSTLNQVDWLTYTDLRYGFSLEYPSDWTIVPRDDQPGAYGGVLTFVPQSIKTGTEAFPQIVVGLYTLERDPKQSLLEWRNLYQQLSGEFAPAEIKIEQTESIQLSTADNQEGLTVIGASPLTRFQVTNIPRGRTVWFLWTNGDAAVAEIYAHMLASFKFFPKTPLTLTEAFGPVFQPKPRLQLAEEKGEVVSLTGVIGLPDSSWRVPTPGGNTSYTVKCGSSWHTGLAAYATDVSMVANTAVHSAKRSWVDFAGWVDSGYGNLMRTSTDWIYPRVYGAYYAHLNSFVLSPGAEASTTRLIAYSGSTGTSKAHLHFHVYSINDAVNVANLITFAENSNYPSVYADCGTMYRP